VIIFKKNQVLSSNFQSNKSIYIQISTNNVKNIIKIKNIFLKLFTNKVSEIHKLMNNSSQKCYDSMLKVLNKELTLVLSDTRELDRVPNTK